LLDGNPAIDDAIFGNCINFIYSQLHTLKLTKLLTMVHIDEN